MEESRCIAPLESVPAETTLVFRIRKRESEEHVTDGGSDVQEAILIRLEDGVASWLNYCQHFTHIKLDKGDGAPMRDGEVICANHGAYFESDTGLCTYGPCEGAYLNDVGVALEDDAVYLTDEEYELVGLGPIPDDGDRTSTSNLEF